MNALLTSLLPSSSFCTQAYETLWDDLTKTYLKNADFAVLNAALLTIRHLLETEALANSNATKVGELEDALFGTLRNLIGDRTVATTAFEEDEIPTLEAACKRIGLLLSFRPAVAAMEETEGDTPTGWSLLLDLANRGNLGYQEEAVVRPFCQRTISSEADADFSLSVLVAARRRVPRVAHPLRIPPGADSRY